MSLPDVVHRFKTMTTKKYVDGVKQHGWTPFSGKLWQRNYWEHIIRNEQELTRIRHYIEINPIQWEHDKLNNGSGNQVLEPRTEYGEAPWMV
jgi:REP element-mobilizing transposase RayT